MVNDYFVSIPKWLTWCFPKRLWHNSRNDSTVYLTFDDGPIPEVTPWVLRQLRAFNAKATFFCIGDNISKHPEIFNQLIENGHQVGNHTYNHLNGWRTSNIDYCKNIERCDSILKKTYATTLKPKLFRPPYGKLWSSQAKHLLDSGYRVVMWDVLSGDFDSKISRETCLENVLNNVKNGSIVVFHDSIKAKSKLQYVLPKVLLKLQEKGFQFKAL